jgi:hypothetical protein
MTDKKSKPYISYLLRLWQTKDGHAVVWRASLQKPGSGERQGFANLQTLFAFLETQVKSLEEEN